MFGELMSSYVYSGESLYDIPNQEENFNKNLKLAKTGDLYAKIYVICRYLDGAGVKQDIIIGLRLLRKILKEGISNIPKNQFKHDMEDFYSILMAITFGAFYYSIELGLDKNCVCLINEICYMIKSQAGVNLNYDQYNLFNFFKKENFKINKNFDKCIFAYDNLKIIYYNLFTINDISIIVQTLNEIINEIEQTKDEKYLHTLSYLFYSAIGRCVPDTLSSDILKLCCKYYKVISQKKFEIDLEKELEYEIFEIFGHGSDYEFIDCLFFRFWESKNSQYRFYFNFYEFDESLIKHLESVYNHGNVCCDYEYEESQEDEENEEYEYSNNYIFGETFSKSRWKSEMLYGNNEELVDDSDLDYGYIEDLDDFEEYF